MVMATHYVLQFHILQNARPAYLIRLLRPYEAYFAERHVVLDGAAIDWEWQKRVFQLVNSADSGLPPELRAALIDIDELANGTNLDVLLDAAQQRGVVLQTPGEETQPADLVLRAYLDHRDVFEAASTRATTEQLGSFIEFIARPRRALKLGSSRLNTKDFSGRLREALVSARVVAREAQLEVQERSSSLRVVVWRRGNKGGDTAYPPRAWPAPPNPAADRDYLIVRGEGRRLMVLAATPTAREQYRRIVGRVLFNDEEHFASRVVFTAAPFAERGRSALSADGVASVDHAMLRDLTVRLEAQSGCHCHLSGDNLSAMLDTDVARTMLAYGEVCDFTLALSLPDRRRPLTVKVTPPMGLQHDSRRHVSAAVRDFLLARGFMCLLSQREDAGPS